MKLNYHLKARTTANGLSVHLQQNVLMGDALFQVIALNEHSYARRLPFNNYDF